jgi:hypothetical protein
VVFFDREGLRVEVLVTVLSVTLSLSIVRIVLTLLELMTRCFEAASEAPCWVASEVLWGIAVSSDPSLTGSPFGRVLVPYADPFENDSIVTRIMGTKGRWVMEKECATDYNITRIGELRMSGIPC